MRKVRWGRSSGLTRRQRRKRNGMSREPSANAVSGTPVPSRHIGGRALWLASRTGEVWARVSRSPPRLPAWLADFLLTGAMMDNTKSIRELGLSYRPIDETIRKTIEWFREEGLFAGPEISARSAPATPLAIENPPSRIETEFETTAADRDETGRIKDRRPKRPEGPA